MTEKGNSGGSMKIETVKAQSNTIVRPTEFLYNMKYGNDIKPITLVRD